MFARTTSRMRRSRLFRSAASAIALASLLCGAEARAQGRAPVPLLYTPLSPTHRAPGTGPFALTVRGCCFSAKSTVLWNGAPRPTTLLSREAVRADIPASDVAVAGTASVAVRSPGAVLSNAIEFGVSAPSPVLRFNSVFTPLAKPVSALLAHDFNGDGIIDLAVAGADRLDILSGDGSGRFTLQHSYPLCGKAGIGGIAGGDFNGDGVTDIIVSDPACGQRFVVFAGDAAGGFTEVERLSKGGYDEGNLALADINGDGRLDFLAATGGNSIAVYLGKAGRMVQQPPFGRALVRLLLRLCRTGCTKRGGSRHQSRRLPGHRIDWQMGDLVAFRPG